MKFLTNTFFITMNYKHILRIEIFLIKLDFCLSKRIRIFAYRFFTGPLHFLLISIFRRHIIQIFHMNSSSQWKFADVIFLLRFFLNPSFFFSEKKNQESFKFTFSREFHHISAVSQKWKLVQSHILSCGSYRSVS